MKALTTVLLLVLPSLIFKKSNKQDQLFKCDEAVEAQLAALREDRRTGMHFHVPLVFALIADAIFLGCRRQNHKHSGDDSFRTTETVTDWTCVGKKRKRSKPFLKGSLKI